MRIDVLGAVRALREDGSQIDLGGPRHREVLARLVAAEGRMVTTDALVGDLWSRSAGPRGGRAAHFVAALRRALEPDRAPRTPPKVLVTEGPGYALRLPRGAVDVYRFEDALAAARRSPASPGGATQLGDALASWRGVPYADVPDAAWAQRERTRLEELRLQAVEVRAGLLLDSGAGRSWWPSWARTWASTRGGSRPGRCWPARSTGTAGRPTPWPPCGGPGPCCVSSSASIPGPCCGGWRRTSCTGLDALEPFHAAGRPPSPPAGAAGPVPEGARLGRAPPWIWPGPSRWRAGTPWSSRAATGWPPPRRPSVRGTPC